MSHLFIDTTHLKEIHTERFQRETRLLAGVTNLPDSASVRAEVAAMLDTSSRPVQKRARPARRLRIWFPRWVGWLRAMPIP